MHRLINVVTSCATADDVMNETQKIDSGQSVKMHTGSENYIYVVFFMISFFL